MQRRLVERVPTIGVVAAAVFAEGGWRGGEAEHESFLRRIRVGRPPSQQTALRVASEAFLAFDEDRVGEIRCEKLRMLLEDCAQDPVALEDAISRFRDDRRDAPFSYPEFLASFGHLFESETTAATIPSAFAVVRLHHGVPAARAAGQYVLQNINR